MGNHIVNTKSKKIVSFSNSVTNPLYCGFLIEGSKIAKSKWEKRLMTFIAEKNQNVVGLGIVGIDLTKLEWNRTDFESQKDFLFRIVQTSRINKSYNKYVFTLKEDIGNRKLLEIEELITELKVEDADESKFNFYVELMNNEFEKCKEHEVYKNHFSVGDKQRCLICSNKP